MLDKRLTGHGGYIDFNALASAAAGLGPGGPAAMMNLLGSMNMGGGVPNLGMPGVPGSMTSASLSSSTERHGHSGCGGSGGDRGNCSLPKGWNREETKRQTGLSAGRIDVYYVSPEGKKNFGRNLNWLDTLETHLI